MWRFRAGILSVDKSGGGFYVMISDFGNIWSLLIKFFFRLTKVRLKQGIVLCRGRFRSPISVGLREEGSCFDESYVRSDLRCIRDCIISKNRESLTSLQLSGEFFNGDRRLPGSLYHF